jgi:hypothetical protein
MKKITRIALAAVLAAMVPQTAHAQTTLTFEGQENTIYSSPITRSGFVIGNVAGQEQHFHEISGPSYSVPGSTSGVFMNDRDTQSFLQAIDGSAFTLSSFDIASYFGQSFTATGFLGGQQVGSISGSLGSLTTTSGFGASVDRVVFDGIGGDGGFALDNIVLNSPMAAAVPEPGTWALMLFGFGGIGTALRRGRRQQKLLQVA